ncbi:DM13 domain-containing protein [Nocardioides sambongensis]|uniref:DM13 domain-containing protein n=1 Tax=Nocardioides sambongensis TaxID=2589074 RepID=UPI0018C8A986|nr:DM13 domain-containing protein [Nocardioides sambongensis]
MGRRRVIGIGAGAVVVVAVAVALALFQPWLLVVDETVEEDLPDDVVATDDSGLAGDGESDGATDAAEQAQSPEPTRSAPAWTELASGDFIDAEHGTTGRARIVRSADGDRQLWLEGLDTSNGPDLHVWVTDRPSGGDCAGCSDSWGIYDDGAYARLGELKGNRGDQRYPIPDDADLSAMTSVVIWCDRFNVAFGTAAIA